MSKHAAHSTFDISVLVVEDQPNMRQVVRKVLKHIGVKNISEAGDGFTALKILSERNRRRPGVSVSQPVGLVVCDWMMPSMTGVELLREVRQNPELSHLRFCMLTGENERQSILTAIEQGVDDYIIKPFATSILEEKLRTILSDISRAQAK